MLKKILMCRPTYYRVDYSINPWMQIGSVDLELAKQQWQALVTQYEQLGVRVSFIDQEKNYPDMVFAADQAVAIDEKTMLLSRFTYPERHGETAFYKQWYESNGYTVKQLPEEMNFEGCGELQRWRDQLFIGTGFRTGRKAARLVGKLCEKEVHVLELVDSSFYHLDTCFMVLNDQTVFYYPPAFSDHSIAQLQQLVPNLVSLDDHDVLKFFANSVVVGSTVLMQKGSIEAPKQLKKLGYTVKEIDVSEFIKAGGGAHCLTGELG